MIPRFAQHFIKSAVLLSLAVSIGLAGELTVLFSPDGGFAAPNRNRTIELMDGTKIDPVPNNAVKDLIQRTPRGGTIKVCMYALTWTEYQAMLIDAALNRGITVKVLLDGVASWTGVMRGDFKKMARAKIAKAGKKAAKRFQLREITEDLMANGGRASESSKGEMIYGTMHEKFGIFYRPGSRIPKDGFFGSANISRSSDRVFAESRFVFRDDESLGQQFAEEFARLWNEYGACRIGPCRPERYIEFDPPAEDLTVLFNAEPANEKDNVRIDRAIETMLWRARKSIDVAMFSFTSRRLARHLVNIAQKRPGVHVRVMMDQTQISAEERGMHVMGPWLEEEARTRRMSNLEVRYKWRNNSYGWDSPQDKSQPPKYAKPALVHFRNPLLHHKLAIVDRRLMAAGSYNWSGTAERRNFENLAVFDSERDSSEKDVVRSYVAEYDALWGSTRKRWPFRYPQARKAQMVTGPQGRALRDKVLAGLDHPDRKKIMRIVERFRGASTRTVARYTDLSFEKTRAHLMALQRAEILMLTRLKDGRLNWVLSD